MKKYISSISFFICLVFSMTAQDASDAYKGYPTKAQWEKIWSKDDPSVHEDVMNAMEVPDILLGKMSTAGFLETCLMYPGNTWAATDPQGNFQRSFRFYVNRSNAYREFFQRKDALAVTIAAYKEFDYASSERYINNYENDAFVEFYTKACYLGLILGQPELVGQMTQEQKKQVVGIGLSKSNSLLTSQIFGGVAQGYIFYPLISILEGSSYGPLETLKKDSPNVASYHTNARVQTRQDLESVLGIAESFVK